MRKKYSKEDVPYLKEKLKRLLLYYSMGSNMHWYTNIKIKNEIEQIVGLLRSLGIDINNPLSKD